VWSWGWVGWGVVNTLCQASFPRISDSKTSFSLTLFLTHSKFSSLFVFFLPLLSVIRLRRPVPSHRWRPLPISSFVLLFSLKSSFVHPFVFLLFALISILGLHLQLIFEQKTDPFPFFSDYCSFTISVHVNQSQARCPPNQLDGCVLGSSGICTWSLVYDFLSECHASFSCCPPFLPVLSFFPLYYRLITCNFRVVLWVLMCVSVCVCVRVSVSVSSGSNSTSAQFGIVCDRDPITNSGMNFYRCLLFVVCFWVC
jgi:hypothetical protein